VSLIDRKLVKQTVMTSVYGVTAVGARAQVRRVFVGRRSGGAQYSSLEVLRSKGVALTVSLHSALTVCALRDFVHICAVSTGALGLTRVSGGAAVCRVGVGVCGGGQQHS